MARYEMLFDRREPTGLMERIRVGLWPRTSWQRSIKYVAHRLRRLRSRPHAIALGCAFGVFMSFTPFFGFQMLIAGLLSWFSRASIVASTLGTFAGNPLTYPFIWFGAYELGAWVLGMISGFERTNLSAEMFFSPGFFEYSLDWAWDFILRFFEYSLDRAWDFILPMSIGGSMLGLVAATLTYCPMRRLVEVYQHRRTMRRLQDEQQALQAGE